MKAYKATDKNMMCKPSGSKPGIQFVLGEWSEPVEGELQQCENGYHFCRQMSGVLAYYSGADARVFECEVDDCIEYTSPGSDAKGVCRRIKLVKEVTPGLGQEQGRNTGDRNTGALNTGDRNTGYSNTGDSNTGYGNATDSCAGFFCKNEQLAVCFDLPTALTVSEFELKYSDKLFALGNCLSSDTPFDVSRFYELPNFTSDAVLALHAAHIARRNLKGNK